MPRSLLVHAWGKVIWCRRKMVLCPSSREHLCVGLFETWMPQREHLAARQHVSQHSFSKVYVDHCFINSHVFSYASICLVLVIDVEVMLLHLNKGILLGGDKVICTAVYLFFARHFHFDGFSFIFLLDIAFFLFGSPIQSYPIMFVSPNLQTWDLFMFCY